MESYIREAPIAEMIRAFSGLVRADLTVSGTFLVTMMENLRLEDQDRF